MLIKNIIMASHRIRRSEKEGHSIVAVQPHSHQQAWQTNSEEKTAHASEDTQSPRGGCCRTHLHRHRWNKKSLHKLLTLKQNYIEKREICVQSRSVCTHFQHCHYKHTDERKLDIQKDSVKGTLYNLKSSRGKLSADTNDDIQNKNYQYRDSFPSDKNDNEHGKLCEKCRQTDVKDRTTIHRKECHPVVLSTPWLHESAESATKDVYHAYDKQHTATDNKPSLALEADPEEFCPDHCNSSCTQSATGLDESYKVDQVNKDHLKVREGTSTSQRYIGDIDDLKTFNAVSSASTQGYKKINMFDRIESRIVERTVITNMLDHSQKLDIKHTFDCESPPKVGSTSDGSLSKSQSLQDMSKFSLPNKRRDYLKEYREKYGMLDSDDSPSLSNLNSSKSHIDVLVRNSPGIDETTKSPEYLPLLAKYLSAEALNSIYKNSCSRIENTSSTSTFRGENTDLDREITPELSKYAPRTAALLSNPDIRKYLSVKHTVATDNSNSNKFSNFKGYLLDIQKKPCSLSSVTPVKAFTGKNGMPQSSNDKGRSSYSEKCSWSSNQNNDEQDSELCKSSTKKSSVCGGISKLEGLEEPHSEEVNLAMSSSKTKLGSSRSVENVPQLTRTHSDLTAERVDTQRYHFHIPSYSEFRKMKYGPDSVFPAKSEENTSIVDISFQRIQWISEKRKKNLSVDSGQTSYMLQQAYTDSRHNMTVENRLRRTSSDLGQLPSSLLKRDSSHHGSNKAAASGNHNTAVEKNGKEKHLDSKLTDQNSVHHIYHGFDNHSNHGIVNDRNVLSSQSLAYEKKIMTNSLLFGTGATSLEIRTDTSSSNLRKIDDKNDQVVIGDLENFISRKSTVCRQDMKHEQKHNMSKKAHQNNVYHHRRNKSRSGDNYRITDSSEVNTDGCEVTCDHTFEYAGNNAKTGYVKHDRHCSSTHMYTKALQDALHPPSSDDLYDKYHISPNSDDHNNDKHVTCVGVIRSTSDTSNMLAESERQKTNRRMRQRLYNSDPLQTTWKMETKHSSSCDMSADIQTESCTDSWKEKERILAEKKHYCSVQSTREEILSFLDSVLKSGVSLGSLNESASLTSLEDSRNQLFSELRPRKARNKVNVSNVSIASADSGMMGQDESFDQTACTESTNKKASCALKDELKGTDVVRVDSGVGLEIRSSGMDTEFEIVNRDGPSCEDCNKVIEEAIEIENVPEEGSSVCERCLSRRSERKETVQEIVNSEVSYGKDLRIIREEFFIPMETAGLLNQEQLHCIFCNLDELCQINKYFSDRLQDSLDKANEHGDKDYTTVNMGKLFLDFSNMFLAYENYCINHAAAMTLLEQLEKEKELLRVFLQVSQTENSLLRRMNLRSFIMLPVQRIMKYPLLLDRLYKSTLIQHNDKEAIRLAKKKIEDILDLINNLTYMVDQENQNVCFICKHCAAQIFTNHTRLHDQTKTKGSAQIKLKRRGTLTKKTSPSENLELHKIAVDLLRWNRNEANVLLTGRLHYSLITDHMWSKKVKNMRFTTVYAVILTLGKATVYDMEEREFLFAKETSVKEAALVFVREKGNKYAAVREPFPLDRCIIAMEPDCDEVFVVQEMSKDLYAIKADSSPETKRWFQHLRCQTKDLGVWRKRRCGLANIMIQNISGRT